MQDSDLQVLRVSVRWWSIMKSLQPQPLQRAGGRGSRPGAQWSMASQPSLFLMLSV